RRALEVESARLAAERRDEDDVAAMAAALERRGAARRAGHDAAFIDADVAFHLAIAVASKNAVLVDLYGAFTSALRGALAEELRDETLRGLDSPRAHRSLFRAIERRDSAGAVRAIRALVNGTIDQLSPPDGA